MIAENSKRLFKKNGEKWMLPNGKPWKIDPFISFSPLLAMVVTDRRIMDRLSSIYNEYESVLFKDKLIFKPADSHGNGIHQGYNW